MSLLKISHLDFAYRGQDKLIDNLDFEVSRPMIVGLLGENGSGKSTLLRLVAGSLQPNRGSIEIANSARSFLPQTNGRPETLPISCLEYLGLGLVNQIPFWRSLTHNSELLEQSLDSVNLLSYRNLPVDSLSGGQMQRLAIARVFLPAVALYILDEPWNNLDQQGQQVLTQKMLAAKKAGSAVICSAHSGQTNIPQFDLTLLLPGNLGNFKGHSPRGQQ